MSAENCHLIAVWGSPNSGKTTFATKLAIAVYDQYQATVWVLYPDLLTPTLTIRFPNEKKVELGSIGIPLSNTEMDTEDLIRNAVVF